MLGPSGSGKTTCLRLIAGFDQPTAGHIEIFGETVEGVPRLPPPRQHRLPGLRAVPAHDACSTTSAYGLMIRGVRRAERGGSAPSALALVKLVGMDEPKAERSCRAGSGSAWRSPARWSMRPKVLLLDEPLGALDLKLREADAGRTEGLQHALGLTFVFVTHDQGEALSMADRVAVFNHGRIEQVGAPKDIYERPRTRFVADFVGCSNVLHRAGSRRGLAASARPDEPAPGKDRMIASQGAAGAGGRAHAEGIVTASPLHGARYRVELIADGERPRRLVASPPAGSRRPSRARRRAAFVCASRCTCMEAGDDRGVRRARRDDGVCGASRTFWSRGRASCRSCC